MFVWFLRYEAWQTEFFVIFDRFLPFYPPSNPKNQNFEKRKKVPGDIIILHKCTKNHDHMVNCSLDITCNRFNCYFSFWAIFCPFTSLPAQKIKIKKKKTNLEISSFCNSLPKIMIICYTLPEIWCVRDVIVIFHFGLFFDLLSPPLPPPNSPNSPKNQNFKKMKKFRGDIIILHMSTKSYDQMMYSSWNMVRDGLTNGPTEKVTYRGGWFT